MIPTSGDAFLKHMQLCIQAQMNQSPPVLSVPPVSSVPPSGSSVDFIPLTDDITIESSSDEDVQSEADVDGNEEDRLGAILKIVKSNSRRLSGVNALRDTLSRLDDRTSTFESQVRLRRQQDNLIFARLKEDADAELNRSREDRVVISGMEKAPGGPSSHQEKKAHYTNLVTDLVAKACPELVPPPVVVDIFVSFNRNQTSPTVEAKFDSVSGALNFRKAASALGKAKDPSFVKLYFSNSVTQATKVRVEIMRAVAKKLTTTTENAFVHGFLSRPLLRYESVGPSVASGTGRNYSFVDVVSKFGDLVLSHELASAYRRAGGTFRGAMEQYFVVLREDEDVPVRSIPNQVPLGSRGGRGNPFRGHSSSPRGRPFGRSSRGARAHKRVGDALPGTPTKTKRRADM